MEYTKKGVPYFDREISVLSFNERVLQEAADQRLPLIERLHFLAIFSSNLDEFYRVRVASIRHLIRISKKPGKMQKLQSQLEAINLKSLELQEKFGRIYRESIMPGLNGEEIFLYNEKQLSREMEEKVLRYFDDEIAPVLTIQWLDRDEVAFPENERLYYFALITRDDRVHEAIIPFPANIPRFYVVEDNDTGFHVIMLDDVIRLGLQKRFQKPVRCYSFKINRDSELYLHDELAPSVKEKIKKSLKKRKTGIPTRFLYDGSMPVKLLHRMQTLFSLNPGDAIKGWQYHNFQDFWHFPYPDHRSSLRYPPRAALSHPALEGVANYQQVISQRDQLLHFPYQKFDHVIDYLKEAARDPEVITLKMTLYRAAPNSEVFKALIDAARSGKEVVVFSEVKARFDEERNLALGEQLEHAGARVLYSYDSLKVHSKICLIKRKRNGRESRQALLSTGNFNEKTAGVYSDLALFTAHPQLTSEVEQVFNYLEAPHEGAPEFQHLLVAQHNMRDRFEAMLDREIVHAGQGKNGFVFCKMNGLQDARMIRKLYQASNAGVEIRLLVRGICCLVPGKKGWSENITVKSIVSRYLEHARIFYFYNDGHPEMYAGSADWMARNLKRRVEVVFPVYDSDIFNQIETMMNLQWQDNIKARLIDESQSNPRVPPNPAQPINSQEAFYQYLKKSS